MDRCLATSIPPNILCGRLALRLHRGSVVQNLPARSSGDVGSNYVSGDALEEGNGNL